MDKRIDIFNSIICLAETTLEGVEHICQRTMDGYFEDTAGLFTDVADSFHEIRTALVSYFPDYESSRLNQETLHVVEGMKMILLAYEGESDVRPMVVMQFSLRPAFLQWHATLQEELRAICANSMN